MRTLGMDLGTKTLGLAISDKQGIIASPYKLIKYNNIEEAVNEVLTIIEKEKIENLVLGLPKNMNNTEGDRCEKTKEFKELLEKRCNLPVILWDERLTTVAADNSMMEMGIRRENRKEYVDEIAAIFILQGYLDYLSNHPQELSADEA